MERPLGLDGFVLRLAELFNRPVPVVVKTRRLMAEYHVKTSKDLPRSRRVEILKEVLEQRRERVGHAYDGDDLATLDLWMAMNANFGSDAVADVSRAGLVTKRFIVSSIIPFGKRGLEMGEDDAFESHLSWLEENGKRLGWRQDVDPKTS